jgi:ATP-dependent RNA helicase DDX35
MRASLQSLFSLGAVDAEGKITQQGVLFSMLPVTAEFGKAILEANSEQNLVGNEVASIAALMEVQIHFGGEDPFKTAQRKKKDFGVLQGDHITYLNIFNKFMSIKNEG